MRSVDVGFRLVCRRRIEDRVVKVAVERGQSVVDVFRVGVEPFASVGEDALL